MAETIKITNELRINIDRQIVLLKRTCTDGSVRSFSMTTDEMQSLKLAFNANLNKSA